MELAIRLFASAREALGTSSVTVELPTDATVGRLAEQLRSNYPPLAQLPVMVISVNYEYASDDIVLKPGDEVAVIPPVSGGSQVFIPLDPLPSPIAMGEGRGSRAPSYSQPYPSYRRPL